jgi:radical SAM protein with 4Fe4S-binding SPASM domain
MEDTQIILKKGLKSLADRLNLADLSQSLCFPKYFEVETIRACNAKCTMCTVNQWEGKNGRMSDSLFCKISEEMSHYSDWINSVCLSRNGEPLIDKNITDKIRILKDYGIRDVTFSTNASLLDEYKSIQLIESGLDDIRFSIDGTTKKTFESIRKGLNFEEVRENCLRFIRLRNERGQTPRIRVRMVLQKGNLHEESAWKEFWKARVSENDIVYSKAINSWGNQLPSYKTANVEKYSCTPCISPWSTMIIHFDGKVPLCGCDFNNTINLGDVNNYSIKEIWQSENFNKIREMHSSGKRNDIPLCPGCNVWDIEEKKVYKNIGE